MSVRYNVATLLRESVGSTREYEVEDDVLMDEGEGRRERVLGRTTFLRTEQGVLVTAHLRGIQRERCSRCLGELELPLRLEIEEEFLASVDAKTGARQPAPEDPEAFRIDAKHTLDLGDAVRQHWTTAVPVQPLCRPDCRGLCPRCGRDLNQDTCSCPPEDDDGRWSALRQIVSKQEGS